MSSREEQGILAPAGKKELAFGLPEFPEEMLQAAHNQMHLVYLSTVGVSAQRKSFAFSFRRSEIQGVRSTPGVDWGEFSEWKIHQKIEETQ